MPCQNILIPLKVLPFRIGFALEPSSHLIEVSWAKSEPIVQWKKLSSEVIFSVQDDVIAQHSSFLPGLLELCQLCSDVVLCPIQQMRKQKSEIYPFCTQIVIFTFILCFFFLFLFLFVSTSPPMECNSGPGKCSLLLSCPPTLGSCPDLIRGCVYSAHHLFH